MSSNRKYSNGMWKDTSKQQDKKSGELFLTFQSSHGSEFKGMTMNFDQLSGECTYWYKFSTHEYMILINRAGTIIQEAIVK